MRKHIALLLALLTIFLPGCTVSTPAPSAPSEAETTVPTEGFSLGIKRTALNTLMQPIFTDNTVHNETVMFLEHGDTKKLLFPIDEVIAVTSYDGKTVYKASKDYTVEGGLLKVTEGSAIPCITTEKYYGADASSLLITEYGGKEVYTHWGEGRAMTDWQICVSYTHSGTWEGFTQSCAAEAFMPFIEKLQRHEDVTVFFYGDSITYGANASFISDYAPFQASYPMLFTQALADLFGYTVRYVNTALENTGKVPAENYIAGTNGTITYINTAVGGWSSRDAALHADEYVKSVIDIHGCDLFVIGVGMNDATFNPTLTAKNVKAVLEHVQDASIVLVSTMVPNPNAVNGWYGNQPFQESELQKLAAEYNRCAVACMTSLSLDILKIKDFQDYSGNNINHPNDFFARVYAQTLLQTVIGYENMR